MKTTFEHRIDIEPADAEGLDLHYANIYALSDSPPDDFNPEKYGMTSDEAIDYLDGFERNRNNALAILGEYINDEERSGMIDEVLQKDE